MDIFERTELLLKEANETAISSAEELEKFRIRFLGTKNVLKDIFAEIKTVPNERKKEFGQLVNSVKQAAEEKFAALQETFQNNTS
ncbi:MAG TPA: phenylalanine--tRNA ligase subunit alpha, partial [Chitinophagales bacterium]|nr:phenylalanine--tRNA ligase subunit alpha [Chitinophagales bacterium]